MIAIIRRGVVATVACAALAVCLSPALAAPAADAPAAAPREVDVQLVLAMDVSGSINYSEGELQRKGIADAFRSKEVIDAIRNGSLGRIAVTLVNFASKEFGVLDVPINWQIISDQKSGEAFAQQVMAVPSVRGRGTSIADAIDISTRLLTKTTSIHGVKQVIDVSGDGPNNIGRPVLMARDEALAQGITINALPIIDETTMQDLDAYFKGCVAGGAGSFVLVAKGFNDFARAIRRKLILEISGLTPQERAPNEPPIVRVAASGNAAPSVRPLPRPGFAPRTTVNPPYPGGCDFPMFGGYFGRF